MYCQIAGNVVYSIRSQLSLVHHSWIRGKKNTFFYFNVSSILEVRITFQRIPLESLFLLPLRGFFIHRI